MRSDVCLILEGTYPYVAGGVSTWVEQILAAMPQLHFSILYIGPTRDSPRTLKYRLPPNVLEIKEVFVHDYATVDETEKGESRITDADWRVIREAQRALAHGEACDIRSIIPILDQVSDSHEYMRDFAYSRQAWETTLQLYEDENADDLSFLDYYWTHQFINLPPLNLLRTVLPRARIYHSASTGYAGLLGARASITTGAPLLITEHGLYTRERRLEIFNADWINSAGGSSLSIAAIKRRHFFKEWWTLFFLALSRTAYRQASKIFTLFEDNRKAQIADGADPDKLQIIPNGIDVTRFNAIQRKERGGDQPVRIGFIGRVTAIKDVKTLIRALQILSDRKCRFEAFLLGPLDEEPEYADECLEVVETAGLSEVVHFMGRVDMMEYYGILDVVVLTSVSEGLPFVILEANCAGIPVVATNVGACRELLYGRAGEDHDLGPSGIVTDVASPSDTAMAIEKIADDRELAQNFSRSGKERVRRFYDMRNVMIEYLDTYERHLYARAEA